MNRFRGASRAVQAVRFSSSSASEEALYLNPHAWQGLPADQIFELQKLRKKYMGTAYSPNDEERKAVLSTISALANNPKIGYAFEIDNFKERFMNNTPMKERGLPAKLSNQYVIGKGATPHEKRRIEHLNRVCAYEMPLLVKYRQPYVPKPKTETPLKLTYHTDFGKETTNKFNRKVILEVSVDNLKLDAKQLHKFKVLADEKYNSETNIFTMESNQYREAAQNVNWLVDTFNKLLVEAKDLSKEDFADVPEKKTKTKQTKTLIKQSKTGIADFPKEWKRPQDAPIKKHAVVNKLVDALKKKGDQQFINKIRP